MSGFNSSDDVYLDELQTIGVTAFEFLLIDSQYGLPTNVNGVMGFSRDYSGEYYVSGPLFY
jgi:hypothetical protein